MIILHKVEREAGFCKVFLLVTFQKEAPLILKNFWFNEKDIRDECRYKFQIKDPQLLCLPIHIDNFTCRTDRLDLAMIQPDSSRT